MINLFFPIALSILMKGPKGSELVLPVDLPASLATYTIIALQGQDLFNQKCWIQWPLTDRKDYSMQFIKDKTQLTVLEQGYQRLQNSIIDSTVGPNGDFFAINRKKQLLVGRNNNSNFILQRFQAYMSVEWAKMAAFQKHIVVLSSEKMLVFNLQTKKANYLNYSLQFSHKQEGKIESYKNLLFYAIDRQITIFTLNPNNNSLQMLGLPFKVTSNLKDSITAISTNSVQKGFFLVATKFTLLLVHLNSAMNIQGQPVVVLNQEGIVDIFVGQTQIKGGWLPLLLRIKHEMKSRSFARLIKVQGRVELNEKQIELKMSMKAKIIKNVLLLQHLEQVVAYHNIFESLINQQSNYMKTYLPKKALQDMHLQQSATKLRYYIFNFDSLYIQQYNKSQISRLGCLLDEPTVNIFTLAYTYFEDEYRTGEIQVEVQAYAGKRIEPVVLMIVVWLVIVILCVVTVINYRQLKNFGNSLSFHILKIKQKINETTIVKNRHIELKQEIQ